MLNGQLKRGRLQNHFRMDNQNVFMIKQYVYTNESNKGELSTLYNFFLHLTLITYPSKRIIF